MLMNALNEFYVSEENNPLSQEWLISEGNQPLEVLNKISNDAKLLVGKIFLSCFIEETVVALVFSINQSSAVSNNFSTWFKS